MPRFLVPKKHGPHRVAAIALFRALLRQCNAAPFSNDERTALQNIVRNNYKHNAEIHSTRLLKLAFHAGYEALDHLDNAIAGSPESQTRITDILSKAPAHLTRAPKLKSNERATTTPHHLLTLPPGTGPIATRPRLFLTPLAPPPTAFSKDGAIAHHATLFPPRPRRRIPTLANANGVPFLRFTKPQPPNLTRQINDRIKQQQRRFTLRDEIEEVWIPLARQEDAWDAILRKQVAGGGRLKGEDENEGAWVDTFVQEARGIMERVSISRERWQRTAAEMQRVVDEEKALAEREKEEWKREKERIKKERSV